MKKLNTLILLGVLSSLFGCAGQNVPDLVTVEPSQSAFLVPLEGQTSNQSSFNSEAFLESHKIASKRITIEKIRSDKHLLPQNQIFFLTISGLCVCSVGRGCCTDEWIIRFCFY